MAALNAQLLALVDTLKPTDEERARQQQTFAAVQQVRPGSSTALSACSALAAPHWVPFVASCSMKSGVKALLSEQTCKACSRVTQCGWMPTQVLLKRWPEGKVHVFGSTANCLSICNNNDIDVCFEMDIPNDDQVRLRSGSTADRTQ